ncbi:two-component response regulator [Klebsiella michiganensis]|nr:two-component response regulator [Klebsiella michiganensis]
MSYSWFSRLFKKVSRYNFKEYLTLVRLNKARTLLRDTRTPITEISHSCGFQEHKYLIAAFNKYCGVTPPNTASASSRGKICAKANWRWGRIACACRWNHALLERLAASSRSPSAL